MRSAYMYLKVYTSKKFFKIIFAETESLWSQLPITVPLFGYRLQQSATVPVLFKCVDTTAEVRISTVAVTHYLKVHKHEIVLIFIANIETLYDHGQYSKKIIFF
jgi:hypothetical protein